MAKVSDRNAALLLTAAVYRLGHDAAEFNLNRSSIHREVERIKRRQKIAENLKKEFTPTMPLIIHWDRKLMEDMGSRETVDRLPVSLFQSCQLEQEKHRLKLFMSRLCRGTFARRSRECALTVNSSEMS